MNPTTILVLPNICLNPIYVEGLESPLTAVADVLDEQGKREFAFALRNAITICQAFSSVNLRKTHILSPEPPASR